VRFELLGPCLVDDAGAQVSVAGGRLRVLLAALLLAANRPVAGEVLAEAVWDGSPPTGYQTTLRSHVMRLRRALPDDVAARIVARPPGYLIQIDQAELDVLQFDAACREAAAELRAERWTEASQAAIRGLNLWRGTPLVDVPSQPLRDGWLPQWEQQRTQLIETRVEADLRLGHDVELVPELRDLIRQHPLRERLHAHLMLALARAGRPAEALEAYGDARRVLADELGIDPGPDLQALQTSILAGDAAPVPRRPAPASAMNAEPQPSPVPQQLPAAVRYFTGRDQELKALSELLDEAGPSGGPVVITAIGGTAGIGKTALAVHWAHQVTDRFPDGQLYVNLRGFTPTGTPTTPHEAIRGFLDALGIPPQRIPATLEAQTALYRSLLAGKQMLVILDNARDADQVRPLLPGMPGCMAVATSRNQLTGLVAAEAAHPITLDLLTTAEARDLLTQRLGADRVGAEPGPVDAIITHCARLPLALAIAAAHAAMHPTTPLAALADQLADAHTGLDTLSADEPIADIRAVFSWSYRTLAAAAARLFRLLGLHPGPDTAAPTAASLAGIPSEQVPPLLAELSRAHLLTEQAPGRYTFHDLLRAYAAEQAHTHDTNADRRAALSRLFDHYLSATAAAMDLLHPAEAHRRPRVPPPATPTPDLTDAEAARAWLDTERRSLVAVAGYTAAHGWCTHTIALAATLFRYLNGGHFTDALAVHGQALHAARHTDDRAGQALALTNLGATHMQMGRYQQAAEHLQQALLLYPRAGDEVGQARARGNLGIIETRLGRYRDAAGHLQQALALYRQTGDQVGQDRVLVNLGIVEERLGRYETADDYYEQALALCRQIGNRDGEANALNSLGLVEQRLGRYQDATGHLQQALALFRQLGIRSGEARTLDSLGILHTRLGRHAQATEHFQQALAIFRETGERDGEAWVLNGLGEAAQIADRPADALTHHTAAHTIAMHTGSRDQQARAHTGLGHAHHSLGNTGRAREHYQQALILYTDLGMPDADHIRGHLDVLDSVSSE
jgi:DNA-binding SARP family transcriptional activator/tetratricopeptide (TPR) repeat protein